MANHPTEEAWTSLTARTTGVSNPLRSPSFRPSASVAAQSSAFAPGVPGQVVPLHRSLSDSLLPCCTPGGRWHSADTSACPGCGALSPPAYGPFTPNVASALALAVLPRLLARQLVRTAAQPLHARGCGGALHPRASWRLRHRWVRLSPIAQDSRLLLPDGIGPVSQCPCGGSPSRGR